MYRRNHCLEARIEDLFSVLENKFPGFWGRIIKGDYIECLLPSAKDSFRVALIIKSCIKSFPVAESKKKKLFQTYGIRIAVGIGDMRIVDKEHGIMDGEAIYLSGRTLSGMGAPNKMVHSLLNLLTSNLNQRYKRSEC